MHDTFSHFPKGDHFLFFLFAFLNKETLPNRSLPLKERICTQRNKLFPLRVDQNSERMQKWKWQLRLLWVYPFTLNYKEYKKTPFSEDNAKGDNYEKLNSIYFPGRWIPSSLMLVLKNLLPTEQTLSRICSLETKFFPSRKGR